MQPTQWRALPTIGLNRCPAMMHIIANQFTLTEFLLDSLDPAQRADVLVHPKRIKVLGYSILKAMAAWSPFPLPGFRPFPQTYLQALAAIPADAPVLIFGIENIKRKSKFQNFCPSIINRFSSSISIIIHTKSRRFWA